MSQFEENNNVLVVNYSEKLNDVYIFGSKDWFSLNCFSDCT